MGKRLSADDLNTPEKREHLARERKSCADGASSEEADPNKFAKHSREEDNDLSA